MKLAIVGSTEFARDSESTERARNLIRQVLQQYQPEVVISGGAIGIDSIAAEEATILEIPVIEHLPVNARWGPDGYKARNLRIAGDCTHLLAIRHRASTSYGSGWTADRAESMGKVVKRKLL